MNVGIVIVFICIVISGAVSSATCPCDTTTARTTLSLFYLSTGGESSWSTKWNTTLPLCEWFGVSCNNVTLGISLNLDGNNLRGPLPDSLQFLTNIEVLSLTHNSLSGTLPSSYGAWRSLANFEVAFNSLSGTLPAEYGAWGSGLRVFNVGNNQLNGTLPTTFSAWAGLTGFFCGSNVLSGTFPRAFYNWTSFTTLDISQNAFNGSLPLGDDAVHQSSGILWPKLASFRGQ
ncbi:GP46-like surface antigen, putative [Bodo saltans]|uniref:GP46-like surface antigen, putative n=1 Tax=Bodo saltans TaxID=75058 RepID=A0A0S4IU55_BODSA|nr:GP46-like surface antigen, putative [Bodo saltans]|eukprot:CUF32264.1 GP46-like surface antigen, putative [Bodo saltans]